MRWPVYRITAQPPPSTASGRIALTLQAAVNISSHSGSGFEVLDIVKPKVVAMGIRIRGVKTADTFNGVTDVLILEDPLAQFSPVDPFPVTNNVVYRRRAEFRIGRKV
jgi:hypothetical protein